MSKNETPITRWFWRQERGTLIEEFRVAGRSFDGVIVKDGKFRIAQQQQVSLEGRDVIVIQTKPGRLGMSQLGQALFSRELLLQHFEPKSVVSVALCGRDDPKLRALFEKQPNMQVVICLAVRANLTLTPFRPGTRTARLHDLLSDRQAHSNNELWRHLGLKPRGRWPWVLNRLSDRGRKTGEWVVRRKRGMVTLS